MGREGGGDLKTFPTKEEAEKFVENKQKMNAVDVDKYGGDSTDSGRGNAVEEDGGFCQVRVVRSSQTFSSFEQAKKELTDMAEKADAGDDSIGYAIGDYRIPSPESAALKEKETKAFSDGLHETLKVPQGEAFFNVGKDKNFVECSLCHSQCSLSHLVQKERHASSNRWRDSTYVGICPVCHSDAPASKDVVITTDEWDSLTGRSFSETGKDLKRPRTLFNSEHVKECDERFKRGMEMKNSFKKRKTELDSNVSGTNAMVVSCWTSAHF